MRSAVPFKQQFVEKRFHTPFRGAPCPERNEGSDEESLSFSAFQRGEIPRPATPSGAQKPRCARNDSRKHFFRKLLGSGAAEGQGIEVEISAGKNDSDLLRFNVSVRANLTKKRGRGGYRSRRLHH